MRKTITATHSGVTCARHIALGCLVLAVATLTGCATDRTGTGRSTLDVLGDCDRDNFSIKEALCNGTLDRPGTDPNDFFATLEDRPGTDPNDACRSKFSKDSYTQALCSCRIKNVKLIARITYCDTTYSNDTLYNECLDKVKAHSSVDCP